MITLQKGHQQEFDMKDEKNIKSKVININKGNKSRAEQKRERNREILKNKRLDYELKIDKGQLKHENKLTKEEKLNDFKYREVEVKCNIKNLALKAGYTLGRVCLILTFISCLLTFGGNIENFICNVILTKKEAKEAIFVWKEYKSITTLKDGTIIHNYTPLGFNPVTSMIYIPFLIGMQSILYQISLTIYIIKSKFREYYKYALLLQYSMLFYSVYSNYMFISYYVKPTGIIDRIMCFIPSLLLDISCIFFLSLSMRMKTLNFDSKEVDRQDNLLINGLTTFENFRSRKNNHLDKNKEKDITKKRKKLRLKWDKNKSKYKLKNKADIDKILNIKITKNIPENSSNNEKNTILESIDKRGQGNKKAVKTLDKNKGKFKGKKATGQGTNKITNRDINKVKNYIEKLKELNVKTITISDLKKKCRIDKNKWLKIKKILLEEDKYIYVLENKPNTTYIK